MVGPKGNNNISGGISNTNSFNSGSMVPTVISTDSGINSKQPTHTKPSSHSKTTLADIRSDTLRSNVSNNSTGNSTCRSEQNNNDCPTQINYNANTTSSEHIRIMSHPALSSPAPPSVATSATGISPPWQNRSGHFADGMSASGYPPPTGMHTAYQLSSSPVIFSTHQSPNGITYSPSNGGHNYPAQILNGFPNGLPPAPPLTTIQYQQQQQDASSVSGSRTKDRNKRKDHSMHRRVNSYDGPPARSYGSIDPSVAMFSGSSGAPPLPRYPGYSNSISMIPDSGSSDGSGTPRKRSNSVEFSRVSEIRKLTGTIRPPPPLPQGRGESKPRGNHFRSRSEDWQQGQMSPIQPQMFPMPVNTDTSPLQQIQQQQSMVYNRGVYMGGDDINDMSPYSGSIHTMNGYSNITASLRNTKDLSRGDDGGETGGEAVFLLRKGSSHNKSSRASRTKKRHMRQKSAQLFMEDVKGTEQLPSCRDIIFLLLFVFHLLGIIYLGRTYGNEALRIHDEYPKDSESSVTIIITNLIYISGLSGLFAIVVSGFTLLLMANFANQIVQVALVLSITFSFVWGTIGIGLSPKKIVPITGIIALAFSVCYAFMVLDRIPFAAANLNAGLTGILANPGAVFVSFIFQILTLGWSIYYVFVAIGVYDAINEGEINESSQSVRIMYYFLLAISYYWTQHVFLNIVQVTVADVIGKWWYEPDGDTSTSYRIADLKHGFFRSLFYSIGSICFGSLFVGPVRILKQLSAFFKPSDQVNSLMCLHECIHCVQSYLTSCVGKLGARFSPWSYTYVGLYGYSLMDAGLHSTELFEKRGWSTIVSDDLVPNVLLLITLAIAGLTGLFAHLLEQFEDFALTATGSSLVTSFLVGGLVGLVVSSVLFGSISSSVNAVIVLFATSPVDFEENHPKLSEEMRNAWKEVWPGCMNILDMRVQVAGFPDPTLNGSVRGTDLYFNAATVNGSNMLGSERHPLLP